MFITYRPSRFMSPNSLSLSLKYQHRPIGYRKKKSVVFNQVNFTYLRPRRIDLCPAGLGSLFFIFREKRTGVKLVGNNRRHPEKIFKINQSSTNRFNTLQLTWQRNDTACFVHVFSHTNTVNEETQTLSGYCLSPNLFLQLIWASCNVIGVTPSLCYPLKTL